MEKLVDNSTRTNDKQLLNCLRTVNGSSCETASLKRSAAVWRNRVNQVTGLWLNCDKSATFSPLHPAKMVDQQIGHPKLLINHFGRM